MLEPAVVLLRLLQYAGAAILMGSSLFFIYALPRAGPGSAAELRWSRTLVASGAAVLSVAAILGLGAQTAVMAGSLAEGLKLESLRFVAEGMGLGRASLLRAASAAVAVILLFALQGRARWAAAASLGVIATGSFAWMGHGAATEGAGRYFHLAADIIHSWAAAVWVGALVAFLGLLQARSPSTAEASAMHRALHGFAGTGSLLVAVLVVTGLANSWYLIGPDRLEGLWTTAYGRLLSLKLLLFVGMLALAAANRFRLTPGLARVLEDTAAHGTALGALRRSLMLETAGGFAVLVLVAWFGMLAPPSAL